MERATTTASSLDAEQDNGSGPRCQDTILGGVDAQNRFETTSKQSNDPLLLRFYTLRSGEDSMKLLELMELCTKLSDLSEGSEGFHQIIDFLSTSHIKYALTKSPTIYVSLIEQFWQTASASTPENGKMEITATIDEKVKVVSIDEKVKVVSEATIRRHLKLEDFDGINTLPNAKIFEQLALIGSKFGGRFKANKKYNGNSLNTKLILKVIKLEKTVKTSQARRRAKIMVSDDEEDEEDSSKQERSLIKDMDLDAVKSLFLPARIRRGVFENISILNTRSRTVYTPVELVSTAAAVRIQEELDESEGQRMAQVHQAAQGFTDAEWDDILARVAADEDLKFLAQQRAKAKRNKPITPAQQKDYMSTYIKNKEGDSELDDKRIKRAGQESLEEPDKRQKIREASGSVQEQSDEEPKADELSQEQLQQLIIIVPEEGMNVEALQTKYHIIDQEVYSKDTIKFWKIIRVGNYTKRLFELGENDTLWKIQRYMHDLLTWKLYDTCGVHHVSIERGHDIFMLVEKDYPLRRALMTLMLCNKLKVDEYSEMANELLRKIFILANRPRQ
ncbi:hypothetical protein Tco_0553412 [Tanacetum coccineum]